METITIKKSEYDRLKIENETLKKELENTKEPTEFLGKKASQWLLLRDLTSSLLEVCNIKFNFDELSSEKINDILITIKREISKLRIIHKTLKNVYNNINRYKDDIFEISTDYNQYEDDEYYD